MVYPAAEEKPKEAPAEDSGRSLLNRSSLSGILQRLSAGGRDSMTDRHPAPIRIYDDTVRTQKLNSPDELLSWFAPVVREIKQVILRDSWPRFRKSAFYSDVSHWPLGLVAGFNCVHAAPHT